MDRQQRPDRAVERIAATRRRQPVDRGARVPVVGVHEVGLPRERAATPEGREREEDELGPVLRDRRAVDALVRRDRRAANQIHVLIGQIDVGLLRAAPVRDGKTRDGLGPPARPVDRAVARDRHAHVVPELPQRPGQRARHVGKAAHLDEGRGFGRQEENPHGGGLLTDPRIGVPDSEKARESFRFGLATRDAIPGAPGSPRMRARDRTGTRRSPVLSFANPIAVSTPGIGRRTA